MIYNGAKSLENKWYDKGAKITKFALTTKNSVLVFPFEVTLGAINSTAEGLRTLDNTKVTDYSSFQRLFTGLENIIALWQGAYNVEKVKDDDSFLTKTHQVGRSFKAFIPNFERSATFEASSISADFLAEFTDETFNIHTYEELTEEDLYKFFIIPELKEYKWLFITNATTYRDSKGKFHHTEVTLATLNNKIAKSGRAVEAFVHRSAPGEGYAFPIIDSNNNVSVDSIRERDIPTTSIQVEMAGPAAFGNVFAYGRPTITETVNGITKSVFNPKIEAPRLLLPLNMETPIPSPLNTRPNAETDFYLGRFKPTLEEYFADYKKQFEASYNPAMRADFQGVMESVETLAKIQQSNPINQGSHQYTLWDPAWRPAVDKVYNVISDSYTGEKLTLSGSYSIPEILAHNIFGMSPISSLPLSVKQNISWSLSDVPLIGGFLGKATFGIPIGWRETAVRVSMDDILIIQPASLIEYGDVLQGRSPNSTNTKPQVDLLTYTSENKTDAIEYSGVNATGTIIKISLTDRFSKVMNGGTYIFNTKDLGQNSPLTDDDGTVIPRDRIEFTKLLWDDTCKPVPRKDTTPGFIIDATSFKAVAKLDYRLTCFANNTEIWSGTYQTNSKFTKSIRDWTNYIKMSNWQEKNNKVVDYPAAIVAPNPPNVQQPQFSFDTREAPNPETDYFVQLGKSTFGVNPAVTEYYKSDGDFPTKWSFRAYNRDEKTYEYIKPIATFDTADYGGINNFRNNYNLLKLILSERTQEAVKGREQTPIKSEQLLHVDIDTNILVTTGKIETELFTKTLEEQRWVDDETIFVSGFLIKNNKLATISLIAETDNDLIKIFAKIVYKTESENQINATTGSFQNKPDEHSGSKITDVWFNVDKATAVPVVIVAPNGGK